MAIERADIGDLRQALATATAAPHGGRSSDDTFNRFVRTGGAVTVVAAEQLYVRLGDSNGQPRIWLVDPLSPSGEGTWLGVANAPREARELARQLLLAADELERRRFEP
jgi:hypothetical protein